MLKINVKKTLSVVSDRQSYLQALNLLCQQLRVALPVGANRVGFDCICSQRLGTDPIPKI